MNNGWIKAKREWMDDPVIWKDANHVAVWMYLQLNASAKEYKAILSGKAITLMPGQLITGRGEIAERLSMSVQTVRTVLKHFEDCGKINQRTTKQGRLISLLDDDLEFETNHPSTNEQPSVNHPSTINKNKEKESEEEREKYIPPTPQGEGDGASDGFDEKDKDAVQEKPTAAGQGKKPKKGGVWDSRTNVDNLKALMNFGDYGNKRFFREHPAVWECAKAWMAYKDARKPRAPNHYANGTSIGKLLDKLVRSCEEYGDDSVIALVGDSMANNYQGITWDGLGKRAGKPSPAAGSRRGGEIDWASVK